MDHLAWHGARAILEEALATDPSTPSWRWPRNASRRKAGNELAVADETAAPIRSRA
jgi:hypothetical protein